MNWKPIETAPRDGRFFIGANTDEAIVCNWPRQRNCDYVPGNWKKDGKEWYGSSIRTSSPLTHWRALPELPLLNVEVAEGNGHAADASKMVGPAPAPAGEMEQDPVIPSCYTGYQIEAYRDGFHAGHRFAHARAADRYCRQVPAPAGDLIQAYQTGRRDAKADAQQAAEVAEDRPTGEVTELVAWLREQGQNRDALNLPGLELFNQLRTAPYLLIRAADLLERQAAPVPVVVTERLPQPEDCDSEGRCWWWYPSVLEQNYGYWIYEDNAFLERSRLEWPDSWLPFNVLPQPSWEVE